MSISNLESSQPESLETFNDVELGSEMPKAEETVNAMDEDWAQPVQSAPKSKEVKQVDKLEVQEEGDEVEVTPKETKKELTEEEKAKEVQKEIETPKKNFAEGNPKDNIKGKIGDEVVEFDKNMTVKVKVDGKAQEVSVQELMNNFAGKQSYDQKFQALANEKKQAESIKLRAEGAFNTAKMHAGKIDQIIKDPNSNPLDAFRYFIDVQGLDVIEYEQKLLASMSEELSQLMEMDETQIDNYWLKKQLDAHTKKQTSAKAEQENTERYNKYVAKIDGLRAQYNVSEEAFMDAVQELTSEGLDEKELYKTPEKIIEYASKKPLAIFAGNVVEKYSSTLDSDEIDELETKIVDLMYSDKSISEKDIEDYLKSKYSVAKEVKSLNGKALLKGQSVNTDKEKYSYIKGKQDEEESWADFDN